MKAMLISDLIIMRKYLIQQSAIGLVLGVVLAFVMENPFVITPLIGVMVAVTCAFTVLALDERNGWERYRLALPLSRANVVVGRYASLGIATLIGFAVGFVASIIVLAIASAPAAGTVGIERMLANHVLWGSLAIACACGLVIVSVMLSVMLPLALRFGMTKAVRFVPAIVIVAALIALAASQTGGAEGIVSFIDSVYRGSIGIAGLVVGAVAIAIALYAASAAIAAKLYEAREL